MQMDMKKVDKQNRQTSGQNVMQAGHIQEVDYNNTVLRKQVKMRYNILLCNCLVCARRPLCMYYCCWQTILLFNVIVSRDEYFFQGLKNQISRFHMIAGSLHNFWLSFVRTSRIRFLLASMELLTNCENPPNKPLRRACSGFPLAACDSISCFKSTL
jgi:hypothetical protein